jgi:protein-tyrosine-phosphatase
MSKLKVSIICCGNIARSQALHHYLEREINNLGLKVDLFSCGTAPRQAYPDELKLCAEVQKELSDRGLKVHIRRTVWSAEAAEKIKASEIILAADTDRKRDILQRTGIDADRVHLFYEYADEGCKDFTDTFDEQLNKQDPELFGQCFSELERLAHLITKRITREYSNC